MRIRKSIIRCLTVSIMVCAISACNPSGDGNGTPSTAQGMTVSGTANAPNGSLAKLQGPLKAWYASLFNFSEAWAQTIIGFTPIPNATVLVFRINPTTGIPAGPVLVQTTTNGAGGYSLILPAGVTPASDLILQITNTAVPQPVGTADTMSTPLVQTALNVDPISEVVMREVLAYIAANPPAALASFSNNELIDLIAMIRAVVTANPNLVGATIGQTIANIQASLSTLINQAIPQMASGTQYLIVFSTALSNGQVGVPYSQPILAIGAPGPLKYQITDRTLPAGLAINDKTGQITGTPTTQGTSIFDVQVSVAASQPSPVSRELSITIDPPPPPPPAGLERVSLGSAGAEGNGHSPASQSSDRAPSISRDGRYVAFSSIASNLDAADPGTDVDAFLRDRCRDLNGTVPSCTATTTWVSMHSTVNQTSSNPVISGDGNFVAFSTAVPFDPVRDTNTQPDIYRWARQSPAQTPVLASGGDGGLPQFPGISLDGRLVSYTLPPPSGYLFFRDLVNNTPPGYGFFLLGAGARLCGGGGHGNVFGNHNAVMSDAVHVDSAGFQIPNVVAFLSDCDHDPTDTNTFVDVYVVDTTATPAAYTRITTASNATAVGRVVEMSSDGRYVVYSTMDQVPGNGDNDIFSDVYVYDRTMNTHTLLSTAFANTHAGHPAISADGKVIAFTAGASVNALSGALACEVAGAQCQVYARLRDGSGSLALVSSVNGTAGNDDSYLPALNANGTIIAFGSRAMNFNVAPADNNGMSDVFVRTCQNPGCQ